MSNTMTGKKTPLFAVLIGINSYGAPHPDFRPLKGSVPDALEFKSYLEEHLNVPSDHIELLTNENATRTKIINTLKGLKDDDRIGKGDAIFFYYAGHGTEVEPPKHRANETEKEIQAIVPYDCDIEDESGMPIPPIADYVLGILLSKIAEEKGNNITVVFDSCYSGSGTRSVTQIARSMKLQSGTLYSERLDQEILESETIPRGPSTLPDFSHFGLGSHILFAACGHKQLAHENNGRGRFSTALLKLLRQVPHNTLRYSDVLSHPKLDHIPNQDPQCEGLHADRMLFNAKVLPTERKCFPIIFDKKYGGGVQCVVLGGVMHNITPDAEFGVYHKTDITFSTQICVLHVDDLEEFSFTATLPLNAPKLDPDIPIVAVQTKFGKQVRLRIHIPPQDGFRKIYDDMKKTQELKHYFDNIALVDNSKDPHVEITSPAKNEVRLKMYTKEVVPGQAASVTREVEAHPGDLAWILSKMAHFYSEFKHSQVNARISRFVQVEFYELKDDYVFNDDTGFEDTIFKLVEPHSNLCVNGVIELPARDQKDGGKPYGLRLVNRSSLNLHANVFHFSSHDLKISPWAKSHHGCTDHDIDIPLISKGILEIGFGTAGYVPQTFKIRNGLDTEVAFLKIYLSTEPVDLSYLEQLSPFTSSRSMEPYKAKPPVIWADIVVPIILRRHQTASTKHRRK